jgi:TPP-dependent indolepyruvate ferredoxin oxidoreductase alpha subunit
MTSNAEAETAILAKADGTLTAKTASDSLALTIPWPLARLKITSFASGTATLRVVETVA